jgi:uncharacterized membrane protein YedE/YeeE
VTRPRLAIAVAGLAGALFGAGLVVAGMTRPSRILAFLDPLSGWDPSLAFVMAGAVGVYALAYRGYRRRARPWLVEHSALPAPGPIDRSLVVGAGLFGVGWGLAGLCPGPSLVVAATGNHGALLFVAAMLLGMAARR